ncbi:junctional adhesion molecule B isoform X2 [Carettochelys insculpta]|uniref:junctional adhesion molecule B isoform X2 n=1 Tax=Carettochelys insculpta TaxID=44489 RepID=UPI003EBDB868
MLCNFSMILASLKLDREAYGIAVKTDNQHVTAKEFQEAMLSCKYSTGKGIIPRVEWKKLRNGDVSFVYYRDNLVGDLKGRAEMIDSSIRIRNVTRKDSASYRCEVSAPTERGQNVAEATVTLTVLVASAAPSCIVPSSAMSGTVVEMRCKENEGSPASEYKWYRNGVVLVENAGMGSDKKRNISYTMNKKTGTLLFNRVSKDDTGEYYCEASNGIGLPQKCSAKRMQVDDLNISGIIAAVVVVALVMALCGLGVFYAQKKGYFSKENSSQKKSSDYKYTPSEKDFRHTKSFVI